MQPWDAPGLPDARRHADLAQARRRCCLRSPPTCASSSRARRCRRRTTSCAQPSRARAWTSTPRSPSRAATSSNLVTGQVAKNMIQAFWFDLNSINCRRLADRGATSRDQRERWRVLGAGMMGAGIAYVSARTGIDVVLKDVSLEAAERGKDYSRKLLDKAVSRGKITQDKADEVLARITPTADYADLAGCDLVVEAVFEKAALKHEVFRRDRARGRRRTRCSAPTPPPCRSPAWPRACSARPTSSACTSSPPWTRCRCWRSSAASRPPTSALARALDYAAQIKKTPIVVNDSRGFFTSRVIGTFVNEARGDARRGRCRRRPSSRRPRRPATRSARCSWRTS